MTLICKRVLFVVAIDDWNLRDSVLSFPCETLRHSLLRSRMCQWLRGTPKELDLGRLLQSSNKREYTLPLW